MITFRPPYSSMPVVWWKLINEAEAFATESGLGLALVWGHIHAGRYDHARRDLDLIRHRYHHQPTRTPSQTYTPCPDCTRASGGAS